ncbi:MAG: GNAT family N-acetyltransferase [Acidimicrobiaceae bacterium]|jgi:RimJ/RimL family protein N-acetyltransferase|nr:GNAT family N-acetyltransferase [Ilumatobacteraceae bacterium]
MRYRTERLALRTWCEDDLEPFAEICSDPTVMEHFPSVMSRDECVQMIQGISERFQENGFGLWAVEIDKRFAGYVGLNRTGPAFTTSFAPCHEVGWRLAPWAWGHGYASEAARESLRIGFQEYGLDTIYSWTTTKNVRSEAVMKRIGMNRRADLDFEHPGTPGWHGAPHIVYSLSRDQWREYRG